MKKYSLMLIGAMCIFAACKKQDVATPEPTPPSQSSITGVFVIYETYIRQERIDGTACVDSILESPSLPQDTLVFHSNNTYTYENRQPGTYTYNSSTGEVILNPLVYPANKKPKMYYNQKQLPYNASINVPATSHIGNVIYWETKDSSGSECGNALYNQDRFKQR